MKNPDRNNPLKAILSIENLSVFYGKIKALNDVSFTVYPGEIVSLLGSNGAGKTTTLNAVSGVVRPKSGSILFKQKSLAGISASNIVKKGIVHVPEGRRIFPELTVSENLIIAGYLLSWKEKKLFQDRLAYAFSVFPRLKERRSQLGGTLSGGEQQMLAIARAIITGGDLLLLDEPSMGIAPKLVEEIFSTIVQINQTGKTILLVEQNAMMALNISDFSYVIETGSVAFSGDKEELLGNDRITKAYLGT
ncbi:MAG: ABC transporter ATP-binding protein [Anaerolineaceae bacterium]|nr:ABC transporter ATP-binding protein [Anaerolineaceae bacterium]